MTNKLSDKDKLLEFLLPLLLPIKDSWTQHIMTGQYAAANRHGEKIGDLIMLLLTAMPYTPPGKIQALRKSISKDNQFAVEKINNFWEIDDIENLIRNPLIPQYTKKLANAYLDYSASMVETAQKEMGNPNITEDSIHKSTLMIVTFSQEFITPQLENLERVYQEKLLLSTQLVVNDKTQKAKPVVKV